MSLSSLLGVIFGLILVVGAVALATSNPYIYLDWHAFLIVFGGSIAAAFMGYHSRDVFTAFKAIGWMLKKPKSTREGLNTEIMRLIKWSYLVQQKGLPALENEIKGVGVNDPIMRYCMELVITNHTPAELRTMMTTAVESDFEHKTTAVPVLRNMGASAPSFGMIGTLVGLIAILNQMGSGAKNLPAVIGSGMSLALVATLYGVFFARLVFIPAANKLMQKQETDRFRNLMVVEGLIMLAEKKTPRFMQDRLNSFLEPQNHFNIDKQLRGAAAAVAAAKAPQP
ncbi:MAG: MotA/TolQ/ExbB proton channel family protein [Rickettsiales bacterium]|nr:MotA/TolQ/ExbB proton channel family protein [Rickettsiales bacterium]